MDTQDNTVWLVETVDQVDNGDWQSTRGKSQENVHPVQMGQAKAWVNLVHVKKNLVHVAYKSAQGREKNAPGFFILHKEQSSTGIKEPFGLNQTSLLFTYM